MSSAADAAATMFREGAACSQAVLAVFCGKYGLDRETAMRLACGLGGGCKCSEVCGAATGAVLVIGLKHGQTNIADKEAKRVCSEKTAEFIRTFRERHGHLTCRDLLGCDVATPEGKQEALDRKLFTTLCVELVESATDILESSGY